MLCSTEAAATRIGILVLPAVDHLRHGVGQADIGHDHHAELAGGSRIAVGHGDHGALLDALDQRDAGLVDQRVEDRVVAGRGVEEDVLDASRLELRDEQRTARALDLAHRAGGARAALAERFE